MTRITRIAAFALSFAAAGSAFADDITIDSTPHASTKSRAEVQGELATFKAQRVNPWSISYDVRNEFKSERSRAEVVADLTAARASGELAATSGEDSSSFYLALARQTGTAGQTLVASGNTTR